MSKKTILMKTLVPLSVAGLLLTGCSGGGDSSGGSGSSAAAASDTLRVNWGALPDSWAPGTQEMEPGHMRVPYETLVLRDKDGTISPNLATEWEFGEGAMNLTMKLRDDVTFHDGTPFNAEAVKANTEYVSDVVGGQFGGPLKAGVESVEVVDDHTVKFNFTRPYGTFLALLSQRNLPIASPTAIADGSIETHPVGTSPWAYDESKSVAGTKAFFGENTDYWGEKPYFANIEVDAIVDETASAAALLSGDLDVSAIEDDEIPRLESAPNADYLQYEAIRNNITFFDRGEGGVFEDAKVRQALCLAMDANVVSDLKGGVAHNQHFVEGEPGYSANITGFQEDLDAAKKLWAELGNPTVNAEIGAAPFNKQESVIRAEQMSELPGVTITVQELTVPQYLSTWNSGQYALGMGNNPQITPADWYGAWFSETAPANPSKVVSGELKGLAVEAQKAGGGPEADAKWEAVMEQISDEALACNFLAGEKAVGYNTDTVTDVQTAPQVWEQNLIDYHAIKPAGA
ncbi:ABC transporter substrate-binding protein [Leucobacter sp. HY1910]